MRTWLTRAWQVVWPILRDYSLTTVGALLVAVGTRMFLIPNDVVSGGVTGISFMLTSWLQLPIGIGAWMLIINTPILLIAQRFLGGGASPCAQSTVLHSCHSPLTTARR